MLCKDIKIFLFDIFPIQYEISTIYLERGKTKLSKDILYSIEDKAKDITITCKKYFTLS